MSAKDFENRSTFAEVMTKNQVFCCLDTLYKHLYLQVKQNKGSKSFKVITNSHSIGSL